MRQPTKVELTERNNRLRSERDALSAVLRCVVQGEKPHAIERFKGASKGERYEYRLFRPTAPHGGVVMLVFRFPNQSDTISTHYLSDLESVRQTNIRLGGEYLPHAIAIERLQSAARHAWAALKAS